MSVTTKVAMQLNCKLGGELWAVEIPVSHHCRQLSHQTAVFGSLSPVCLSLSVCLSVCVCVCVCVCVHACVRELSTSILGDSTSKCTSVAPTHYRIR